MRTFIQVVVVLIILIAGSSQAIAQQVKDTGVETKFPLKTVVIKDPAAKDLKAYFANTTIVRFWVYKAGSLSDVTKILESFKNKQQVEKITEGDLSGDYKEFILTLKAPQTKAWFKKVFTEAGFRHISVNESPATALSEF